MMSRELLAQGLALNRCQILIAPGSIPVLLAPTTPDLLSWNLSVKGQKLFLRKSNRYTLKFEFITVFQMEFKKVKYF